MAIKLTSDLHVVASGSLGFMMTDPFDCNCYLWEYADGQFALFDSGAGREMEPMLDNLKQVAGDLSNIRYIFLTHHHADHFGGTAKLRMLSGALTVASGYSGALISSGDEEQIGLAKARSKGNYPADYRIHACPIDIPLEGGDMLSIGRGGLTAIATPGHCRGALSFLFELKDGRKALGCGDVVFPGGKIMLLNLPDCSIEDYGNTMDELNRMTIDVLLPGHAGVVMNDASEHIAIAHSYFDKLIVPPSL